MLSGRSSFSLADNTSLGRAAARQPHSELSGAHSRRHKKRDGNKCCDHRDDGEIPCAAQPRRLHQSPAGEPGTLKYRTDETSRIALPHNKIVDAKHVDVNQVDTFQVDGKNVNAKSVEPSAVDRKRSLGDAVVMDEHEITVAQLELRQLLADNVRRFRNAQNVSQEGLAALAGLHRTYVSQIERKVTNTSLDNIAKLALALRIHAGELLQKPQVQTGAPTDEAEAKAGTHPNSRRG